MPLPSKFSRKSDQTDELNQLPRHGIATAAIGALGIAMISPLVLAVGPGEFISDMSFQSFAIGLVLAMTGDYTLGHLTDDGRQWPALPVWLSPHRRLLIGLALGGVGIAMTLIPAPSWAPVVAIGGMHAFVTASAAALILGATHSAVWTMRQRE
jgi:hypothetical protein